MAETLGHSSFGETVSMEIGEFAALGDDQIFQIAEILATAVAGKESLVSLLHGEVTLELIVECEHFLLCIDLLLLVCHIGQIMKVLPCDFKARLDHLSLLDEIFDEQDVTLLRKILLSESALSVRR